ncbi:DUF4259 domain-containing protein [Streptomyces sp. NPDC057939]|uniref:DUF4259 domain-containing protein n=1 Tax=Streptomyces sp. NPDC057939 TaxID=3346284 RepID=UPI0036E392A8
MAADLRRLAFDALGHVVSDRSELAELWAEAANQDQHDARSLQPAIERPFCGRATSRQTQRRRPVRSRAPMARRPARR